MGSLEKSEILLVNTSHISAIPIHNCCYHTIISSKFCVCVTDYEVWYREDSQREINAVPAYPDCRELSLAELVSATRGLTVTHMYMNGDIPPLELVAPHLKHLGLFSPSNRDQSDRSVSLIIHQYKSLIDLHKDESL